MKFFSKLPAGTTTILSVMGIMAPVMAMGAMSFPGMMRYWVGAYLLLAAVAGMATLSQARAQAKSEQGFNQDIKDNAARTAGVRDPEKLGQQYRMQQEFQKGIDTYKKYGKDIYSLPWYVVVGEASSGKSEAIRRSEIGLPDKLNDRMQGVGGTIDMHWWFTNQGVILDTAGRLFIQDGVDAASAKAVREQWISFLRMLVKNRPHCPINGMILVIPATSLAPQINASGDQQAIAEIDQKAGQISNQLETIQSELGVRFPVYILITKMDRITGFREFFSNVRDAKDRYQIFGWSNPTDLDTPFNYEAFEAFTSKMTEKLRQRVLVLLKDPTPQHPDETPLRFDEVDALYTFPDSFSEMAPKLKRYLQNIFLTGDWNAKPCFLRGIYFTSALQRGAVLDRSLALALGEASLKDLESQADTDPPPVFGRSRSFFLRDLFLEKIFKEKGLVTKAKNVRRETGSRRRWLLGSIGGALALIAALGFWTSKNAPEETLLWKKLNDSQSVTDASYLPVVSRTPDGYAYSGANLHTFTKLDKLRDSRPNFGWMFIPMVWTSNWGNLRNEAFRTVVEQGVAGPLIDAVLDVLSRPGRFDRRVSSQDLDALKVLVRLKASADHANKTTDKSEDDPDDDAQGTKLDAATLATLLECLFGDDLPDSADGATESRRMATVLSHAFPEPEPLPRGFLANETKAPGRETRVQKLRGILSALFPQVPGNGPAHAATGGSSGANVRAFLQSLKDLGTVAESRKIDFEKVDKALAEMDNAAKALNAMHVAPLTPTVKVVGGDDKSRAAEHPRNSKDILSELRKAGLKNIMDRELAGFAKLKPDDLHETQEATPQAEDASGLLFPATHPSEEAKLRYQELQLLLSTARHLDRHPTGSLLSLAEAREMAVRADSLPKEAGAEYQPIVASLLEHWKTDFVRQQLVRYLKFPLVNTPATAYRADEDDPELATALTLVRLVSSRKEDMPSLKILMQARDAIFDPASNAGIDQPRQTEWVLTFHQKVGPNDFNSIRGIYIGESNHEPKFHIFEYSPLGSQPVPINLAPSSGLSLRCVFKGGQTGQDSGARDKPFAAQTWGPVHLLLEKKSAVEHQSVPDAFGSKWQVFVDKHRDADAEVWVEIDAKGKTLPNPDLWPTPQSFAKD